jgi:magnesium-protoporphyrin O-methyltransferase
MSDCCTPKGYRTIFSERSAHSEASRYRRQGLDALSRRVAGLAQGAGLEGRTVLEVGGGVGAIEIELLKSGAERATNVELTPTYEEAADQLLREAGLADRVERRLGDFVETGDEVAPADIVILNRVVCCYPDMPRLAGAAAEHARRLLVMSFPNDRWFVRLGLSVANLGFRLFRVQFRIFLHPPERILAEVGRHGFRQLHVGRGLLWQVAALERYE